MRNDNITRLTLAGMFAALAFVCFTYLRIEIPMGGGMTGKIYIGHAFILLSALILGAKYGALTGAIGLSLADILAGYTTSAPPTFLAKFLLGLAVAFIAHKVFNLHRDLLVGRPRVPLSFKLVLNLQTKWYFIGFDSWWRVSCP